MDEEILYREECYQIQGAVFEVYREMGCGFLEAVYQECLGKELSKRGIPFVAHPELRLCYKSEPLRQTYIPDFICHESIVELKRFLSQQENIALHSHSTKLANNASKSLVKAQVLNYLKATGMSLGLLVNFGCHSKATIEGIVL